MVAWTDGRFVMERIAQRMRNDCGVAAVAMVAGVTYEEAKAAFRFRRNGYSTNADDCIKALRRLGVKTAPRFLHGEIDDLPTINSRALVKVNRSRKNWHWVAFDPGVGLVDPGACKELRPYSYLAVQP